MKNMKISVFYAMVIATTIYCGSDKRFTTGVVPLYRAKPLEVTPTPSKKSDAPKNSNLEIIGTFLTLFQMGEKVYSWFPNEANQREIAKNKNELEEYNNALTKQREIDKAKRAFNQCCRDNNGLNVDRMATGLAKTCQEVAMSFAALGYREEVEETIEFYNKFRE